MTHTPPARRAADRATAPPARRTRADRPTVPARRLHRLAAVLLAVLLAGALVPAAASAHGIGGSPVLPVPDWLFAWAAAIVLVVSFVGLSILWPKPRLVAMATGRAIGGVPAGVAIPLRTIGRIVLGFVGIALFVLVVLAGLFGTDDDDMNLAPTAIYVALWVGLPVLSAFVGDLWRVLSPWRAVLDLVRAVATATGRTLPTPREYPERFGHWPAATVLLAFAWLELAAPDRDSPLLLGILVVLYAVVMAGGTAVYGGVFLDRADGFANVSRLASTVSPLRWGDDGVRLRWPGSGVAELKPAPGLTAVVLVLLGTTTFDGFTGTGLWGGGASSDGIAGGIQDVLGDVGFGATFADAIASTIGVALGIAFVTGLAWLGATGTSRVTNGRASAREVLVRFAPTFAPIAVGYAIAHYASLLLSRGQAMGQLVSDPLGHGWNLIGTARWGIDASFPSADLTWVIQIVALVGGHVVALVAAHDLALRTFKAPRTAVRSQQWMLGVMVGFTCIGLWLVTS